MAEVDSVGPLIDALKQTPSPEYCLLTIQHWSTCMTKAEWAAWFQAVLSAVAIVAAVRVVYLQGAQQRRAQKEANREIAAALADRMLLAAAPIVRMAESFKMHVPARLQPGVIQPQFNLLDIDRAVAQLDGLLAEARHSNDAILYATRLASYGMSMRNAFAHMFGPSADLQQWSFMHADASHWALLAAENFSGLHAAAKHLTEAAKV